MESKNTDQYVHGYSPREAFRLSDQANTLSDYLHHDTHYPAGTKVLEAGCGVGAQTVLLTANSPDAEFVSIDFSKKSLEVASQSLAEKNVSNVTFMAADIFNLPFEEESFDHVFLCFVLEHLSNPVEALGKLKAVLKKGGTLTVIEGDHGSTYFHPESKAASQTIDCLVKLHAQSGQNSLIGRQLYPLLKKAGLATVDVSPRMIYVDSSRPQLVEGFTKNTFIAMVEGVRDRAIQAGMIDTQTWDKGIEDLYKAAGEDGTFSYTFFKAVGIK